MAKNPDKKLATYVWVGTDKKGNRVTGEQEAPTPAFVRTLMRRQGVQVKSIKKKGKSLFATAKKLKTGDIAMVTRQIATMLSAGIPVAQSLAAIGRGHENEKMRELLTTIRQDVEGGTAFSQALAKFPLFFNRLYVSLVAVGEQSGTLDTLMEKLATYMEEIEEIKGKLKSAMVYPAAVVVVAVLVTALLLLFVIPQFEELFSNFGADLPALTQLIVDMSRWFQDFWWMFFGILIGTVVGFIAFYKRSPKFQFFLDRVSLKAPIFGQIIKKASIARFTRTLATMFGAGVPLVDALGSVAGASGNRVYYNASYAIRNSVSTGRPLEASMADTGLFPPMVLQMVATGEESGEIETMLHKAADFYEREVKEAVDNMAKLIEPLMMVILGGLVGTLVVAMYLPIFKMAAAV